MRRAKASKARTNAARSTSVVTKAPKQVDLNAVREQITNLVGSRALAMVETTIDEVDKGHYLAMKYLFEMVGLCPARSTEEAPQEDSLAKTLLRRLQLPEDPVAEIEVTKDCPTDTTSQDVDTVK